VDPLSTLPIHLYDVIFKRFCLLDQFLCMLSTISLDIPSVCQMSA
jgi:hypothetical protein